MAPLPCLKAKSVFLTYIVSDDVCLKGKSEAHFRTLHVKLKHEHSIKKEQKRNSTNYKENVLSSTIMRLQLVLMLKINTKVGSHFFLTIDDRYENKI